MKTRLVSFCSALIFSLLGFPTSGQAQIIFRPGPGLNDGTDMGTATAGKDASGGSCVSPSDNYGANNALFASPQSTCNVCNNSTWLQFDVSTLPSVVTSVYLGFTHLPHTTYCYSNCSADFYFYPVTSSWNEMTVSRAAPPTRGSAAFGPVPISFPNNFGLKEYDITALYNQWKSGAIANNGLEISSPSGTCNNASVLFYTHSSDSQIEAQRPYLRVVAPESIPTQSTLALVLTGLCMAAVAAVLMRRQWRVSATR